ncbi:helix-turn-helix domain-containing protein [Caldimonas sp. KR1-144]|uniref:helix-turn-helix domain-containing protein n=1 Tax=Caldimonas sp. KR1-144 TaxID=3400911 RepID=UPI003C0DF1F2
MRQAHEPGSNATAEPVEHYLLLWQRAGAGWASQEDRRAVLAPGVAVLIDERRPYAIHYGPGEHDEVMLQIPCNRLETHIRDAQDLTLIAIDNDGPAGRLLASIMSLLRDARVSAPSRTKLSLSEAMTSVVAAALRELPGAKVREPSKLHGYYLRCVQRYLDEHVREPDLSVGRIADAVGVSSDHLARLFKAQPLPVSGLVRKMRMDGCGRDLRDPRLGHRSIGDIAFAWGFGDMAHFSRTFKRAHGMPPSEWRRGAEA